MKRLFYIVKEPQKPSSLSVHNQKLSLNLTNMAVIKIKEVFDRGIFYFYVYIEDLSEWIELGNKKLQSLFENTLVNGLCYDKLSRLNQMISISGELISNLKQAQPQNLSEVSRVMAQSQ